jgi:hypothetical protein
LILDAERPEGARQACSVSGKSRGSESATRFISTSVKYTKAAKEEQGGKAKDERGTMNDELKTKASSFIPRSSFRVQRF